MDPRYPRYLVDSIFFGGTRNFFFGGGGHLTYLDKLTFFLGGATLMAN